MSDKYEVPPSKWPIIGSIALFSMASGFVNYLQDGQIGPWVSLLGIALLLYMIVGWIRHVIIENRLYYKNDSQMERSFRLGMLWFIFTEVMFFAALFGVLYYVRIWSIPYLSGDYQVGASTHFLLWPHFSGSWPLMSTPDPSQFMPPDEVMAAWGIPAINTLILLLSGVTITVAHWELIKEKYYHAAFWQLLTILLGILFLCCQAYEYYEAYHEMNLRFDSGIYGNVFYFMTGFHGLHVTLGTIMLTVILFRIVYKHFSAHDHFAFEAVAWYWHMVDVVWLLLFVFVYCI